MSAIPPYPLASTRIPKGFNRAHPKRVPAAHAFRVAGQKSSQPGPVRARCSRGWADIGVGFRRMPADWRRVEDIWDLVLAACQLRAAIFQRATLPGPEADGGG